MMKDKLNKKETKGFESAARFKWWQLTIVIIGCAMIVAAAFSITFSSSEPFEKRVGSFLMGLIFLFFPMSIFFLRGLTSNNRLVRTIAVSIGISYCFGSLWILASVFPSFSLPTLLFGIIMVIITALLTIIKTNKENIRLNWFVSFFYALSFSLVCLTFAIRSWMAILHFSFAWLLPLLLAYLVAIIIPIARPNLSALFYREQMAPRTLPGNILLKLALALGPAAGTIGAAIGMYSSRMGKTSSVILIMAIISTLLSTLGTQAIMHPILKKRPQ